MCCQSSALPPSSGVKNVVSGLAVEQEQRHRRRDRRQDEHEQHRVGLDRPDEERDAHPGHPRRAHVVDRDDEVDRPGERRERGQVEAEDPEVLARPGAELGRRERRVRGPARTCAAPPSAKKLDRMTSPPSEEEPVRERVQPRERHVPRADHQRHEVVAEAREHRDDEEEDHRRPVQREQLVVGVLGDEVVVRLRELGAHQERHHAGREEEEERGDDVEDPDPLVVDRRQPAGDAAVAARSGSTVSVRTATSPGRLLRLRRSEQPRFDLMYATSAAICASGPAAAGRRHVARRSRTCPGRCRAARQGLGSMSVAFPAIGGPMSPSPARPWHLAQTPSTRPRRARAGPRPARCPSEPGWLVRRPARRPRPWWA